MKHQPKRPDFDTFDGVSVLAGPPRSAFRHSKRPRKIRSFRKTHLTQAILERQRLSQRS
jgi:hypothetical protein